MTLPLKSMRKSHYLLQVKRGEFKNKKLLQTLLSVDRRVFMWFQTAKRKLFIVGIKCNSLLIKRGRKG